MSTCIMTSDCHKTWWKKALLTLKVYSAARAFWKDSTVQSVLWRLTNRNCQGNTTTHSYIRSCKQNESVFQNWKRSLEWWVYCIHLGCTIQTLQMMTSDNKNQSQKDYERERIMEIEENGGFAHRVAFGDLWQAFCLLDFWLEPVESEIGLLMRKQNKTNESWANER